MLHLIGSNLHSGCWVKRNILDSGKTRSKQTRGVPLPHPYSLGLLWPLAGVFFFSPPDTVQKQKVLIVKTQYFRVFTLYQAPNALYTLKLAESSSQPCEVGAMALQMRALRHGKVKHLAQGHVANKSWTGSVATRSRLSSQSSPFIHFPSPREARGTRAPLFHRLEEKK